MTDELQTALEKLNPEQRRAVECLDGPLMVIAGPGTGKTQLLSLRAANILIKRDAAPQNILCLTYTEAGAEAMRSRLIELIGREAYGIQVSTFHGFASSVRAAHPESFPRPASDQLVTSLRQAKIMDELLKTLPFGSPLSSNGRVVHLLREMLAFVSKVKRSGLSYEALSKIAEQNIHAADWLEQNSSLCDIAAMTASARVAARFETEVERACGDAPDELKRPVVTTPGIYVLFITSLRDTVRRTELVDETGKTAGYRNVRKEFFEGSNKEGRHLRIRKESERLLAACSVAKRYQETLDNQHLYDYDDMIADFVKAVEKDDDLRQELQDTYTYIQVDEFQDTNGAQMRIVELLCEGLERPNVMAVGDDDQAIMRFQGATIECINQFVDRYHPQSVVLMTNYRSTPDIVELGQRVAVQVERRLVASDDKAIRANCPRGDQTEFSETVFRSIAEEYAALARDIRERIDGGYLTTCNDSDKAIAVISPKHAVLKALIPYLVAEGVPFSYRQTQDLFASERMQTMLALVRCVCALSRGRKQVASSCLPQIVCAPELGGDHPSSVRFALAAHREFHGDWLLAMEHTQNERIRGIYDSLMTWSAEASSSPVRELLFRMAARPMAYYRRLGEMDPLAAAEFNAGMRALLNFVGGELAQAGGLGRALRLTDVEDLLESAQKYGVAIEASVSLGAPGAVRLTSAHSSKGLEFDCVYLVDADDATWHKGASGGSLYPSNLLIGDEKDEDDARRLLFVALTRAKRHLELYRASGSTVRELSGVVEAREVAPDPRAFDAAVATEWHDSYRLDTPELVALLDANKDVKHLSASALNAFVCYKEGCTNSLLFPERQVLRLPEAPQIQLEFGSIVHAMMEDIANRVMGPEGASLDEVMAAHRQRVRWMDFSAADVSRYEQRFERICTSFVPWLLESARGYRRVTEAKLSASTAAGTPLFGYLDLLLIDDAAKTVRIVDYKTGFSYKISDDYERQLRFYKLLVESSPQFKGYEVVSMGDFYVEPEKDTGELHPPLSVAATDEEVRSLERLADAVWARIQAGQWDTSAFEQSEFYERALAQQESERSGAARARLMQRAYEEWLVQSAS